MRNTLLRPAWMELNLTNLAHNFREARKLVGTRPIICSVKADAYGHGALAVSRILEEEGADALGVATAREAMLLREGGITMPIVCFSLIPDTLANYIFEYDITPVISGVKSARTLSTLATGKYGSIARVLVAVDTGMGRVGLLPDITAVEEIKQISEMKGIELVGMFSHFACSDDEDKTYSYEQLYKFKEFADTIKKNKINCGDLIIGNSGACVNIPESWLDGVRPGIILYGYMPSKDMISKSIELKPVMSIKANIVHLKRVPKGTKISYGATYTTKDEAVIGTIPVGYADGYLRSFSNKAEVIIKGQRAEVVGRVCMDQFMIDVTHIPDVRVGDEVILMGVEGDIKLDAEYLADIAGTISYEIICGFGNRLEKIYIE